VHHTAFVRVGQRAGDVAQNADHFRNRQRATATQSCAQRFALDERHRVIRNAVDLTRCEERNDLRLLEARGQLNLTSEPVDVHAGHEIGVQHFHHHLASERRLLRHEDAGHAATA
jgi:hypothetical protein